MSMYVFNNGTNWVMENGEGTSIHPTASGVYPPETGWPDINSKAVSLNHAAFGVSSGGALEEKGLAEYLAKFSGADGFWMQWKEIDGVCHLNNSVQYNQFQQYTPSEYARLSRWCKRYTDSCGAGVLVPAEVTAGTGIGPSGEWASVDGNIVLVTP